MYRRHVVRFSLMIHETNRFDESELLDIVRAKDCFSPRYRTAALRHLVMDAPLSVTQGRPFAERRRLVRRHYGV
ncbi:hypothetical protein [Paraburkholderia domus]|uniref:hypothetical protein n=1 Tax=Paraburkholderia domus TaxID=2793075 RepID=UPI0019146D8A|nr:hypothetical protein [Paraburkholderia domus]MBK5064863.1 hypothetical protein [Burkholderia sp. R-70199]CAE6967723.1 hypothetical protein R70199_07877 [Paraburkholderia domus]